MAESLKLIVEADGKQDVLVEVTKPPDWLIGVVRGWIKAGAALVAASPQIEE